MSKTISKHQAPTHIASPETREGSRVAAVGAFAAAPADLALSDGLFAQAQQAINRRFAETDLSPAMEWAASRGAISALIMVESLILGFLVSRSNRLQGSFEGFDEYVEERREHMKLPRRVLSKVLNAPLTAMGKLGEGIETVGKPLTEHDSPRVRRLGRNIVDAGKVNAIGTTGEVLKEAGESRVPLPVSRIAKLSALITGSWVGVSEGVRHGYRGIGKLGRPGELAQSGIGAVARGLDTLTSVDMFHLTSTPVGVAFMGSVVIALAVTGNNVVNYQEHQALEHADKIDA